MMNALQMESCAQALDEVADILERLASINQGIFDELRIRYPLADELGGFACMLREHSKQQTVSSEAVDANTQVEGA